MKVLSLIFLGMFVASCSTFKAERVSDDKSDDKAMGITDKWMTRDTEIVVKDVLAQIEKHKGFQNYLKTHKRTPKIFIAEVQNETSEAYFPIDDLNDELLHEFSASGEFILIDNQAREKILKEIEYQNDGNVDPRQIKNIGKQAGADLLIFGAVRMKPETRSGKTIKEYTVNLRMTNIESAVEVLRTRSRVNKFSDKKAIGW